MAITGQQVKAARLLLGWTQDRLAVETRVSPTAISNFETARRRPSVLIVSTLRHTLEAGGVEFTNGDEPGVKFRKSK